MTPARARFGQFWCILLLLQKAAANINITFCGLGRFIFWSLQRVSKIEGAPQFWKITSLWIDGLLKHCCRQYFQLFASHRFPKLRGASQFWKTIYGLLHKNVGKCEGSRVPLNFGKPPHRGLMLGTLGPFWGRLHDAQNNTVFKKCVKWPFQPSAVVRAIYRRLYGVPIYGVPAQSCEMSILLHRAKSSN